MPEKSRAGKGSHGSLSKAGKVRSQQPKHWDLNLRRTKGKIPQRHAHKHKIPRVSNRRRYEKRELLKRESGQNSVPQRRR